MKTIPRYLIAIHLSEELEKTLRSLYHFTYGVPCPVRTLHTTLIPPFTIESSNTLNRIQSILSSLPEFSTEFSTGKPGIFTTKSRKIFYLPLFPQEPLQLTYNLLLEALKPHLAIDTSVFNGKKLPSFLPHITLNYNFKHDPGKLTSSIDSIQLSKPQLLIEKGPGIWTPTT